MYFEWKNDYSVNVQEIDNQHKRMFEIGEKISDLVLAKDDFDHYDEIINILQELKDYTIYHFDFEEKLMEKYGYPEVDPHKIQHIFMIKKLQKLQTEDIDRDQKGAVIDLIAFVSDWITGHILETDKRYKDFFNEKGLK
jgi:hemerythrin-like metal-binding domain